MKERKPKLYSDYELRKETPYLTLMGELWGVFSDFFGEIISRVRCFDLVCPEYFGLNTRMVDHYISMMSGFSNKDLFHQDHITVCVYMCWSVFVFSDK